MVFSAVGKDMTATDTYYITYHWEDQDNLAGVRPNSVAPTLIDESSASYGADTQYRNVTIQPGPVGQDYQYEFTKVPRYNKRGEPAKWKLNPAVTVQIMRSRQKNRRL